MEPSKKLQTSPEDKTSQFGLTTGWVHFPTDKSERRTLVVLDSMAMTEWQDMSWAGPDLAR